MLRKVQCSLWVLVTLSWLGSAHATPEYPGVIDTTLGVRCGEPRSRCLICHTTARGGQGTAEQPFVREGLELSRGNRSASLISALNELATRQPPTDSDDDGTPDLEELRECGNPSGDELGAGPEYGCDGAQLIPYSPHDPRLGSVAIVLLLLLVQRSRRSQRGLRK